MTSNTASPNTESPNIESPNAANLNAANPNGLRLTVIGCSGTYSAPNASCSAYLVQTNSTSVLLDAGPGSSMELQRHIDLADLDAIVVSHEHPDHWTELPSLYHAYRWGLDDSTVPVYGTAGTRALLDAACSSATEGTFDWTTIDASSTLQIGDLSFSFTLTDHPVETLAIRVESGGASVAYSADTGPDWSPANFNMPIDLLVYETTLPIELEDADIPHVSGREAGIRAAAAGVGKLVITHIPPGHDAAERMTATTAEFSGSVELAAPGRTFTP